MSNRAWMPLHIDDYLADTGHLTGAEHGAYLLLIMHYWQNGCLPENERLIARIARMDAAQWEDSREILAMLFGPGWSHKRIDTELAKADEIIEKRRSAGKARQEKSKPVAQAEQVVSTCSAHAHTRAGTPSTKNLTDTEADASDAPPAVDARAMLWSDGLTSLKAISGKTEAGARAILGKWLKASRDDCALVMSKIAAARDNRMGDPIAWITAALDPPKPNGSRPGVVGAAQRILESENHGSESVFGHHGNAQLLPPARSNRQRNPDEDIFGGAAGHQLAGNH